MPLETTRKLSKSVQVQDLLATVSEDVLKMRLKVRKEKQHLRLLNKPTLLLEVSLQRLLPSLLLQIHSKISLSLRLLNRSKNLNSNLRELKNFGRRNRGKTKKTLRNFD
jgi:hypothetical protein